MSRSRALGVGSQESEARSQKTPILSAPSALPTLSKENPEFDASQTRTRVMRIIDRLNVGGPARHVVWLSSRLDSARFETTLVTGTVAPGEGDMSYLAQEKGLQPVMIPEMSREMSPRDLFVIVKLVRLMLRIKPDVIHTHKAKAGAVGRLAATIYKWCTPSVLWLTPRKCRVVHTFHGHVFHSYYGPAKTRLFIGIERALARRLTDAIIVISKQQRDEINGRFRIGSTEQFHLIPLGIELEDQRTEVSGQRVEVKGASTPSTQSAQSTPSTPSTPSSEQSRASLREHLGVRKGEVLIGAVGRLCEIKNYTMLLEAAALICKMEYGQPPRTRSRFVVIGDGHLRESLERRARELGVADRVTFTGFRRDAPALYHELDLVVLTSLNEGTPLSLIEAMSCGRAFVATEVGGVVDLMGPRRGSIDGFSVWDHGVTVPSGDVETFADAVKFLIERPELRIEMGERARQFVETRLSVDRLIADVEDLYRELMAKKSVTAGFSARRIGRGGVQSYSEPSGLRSPEARAGLHNDGARG